MPSPRGFTLVELMISIALVLVLMVGVNYVFQKTADAVSAGNTTNTFSRDSQSAQAVLFDDFNHVNKNPPCFIIASQIVDQFLNAPDAQSGSDPSLVVVDNAGNTLPIITGLYNYRCHRTDLVKFFVRGNYQRRSANDGSFTSQTTSQDAFVTLGHALLPTNDSSNFVGPVTDNGGIGYNMSQFAGNGPQWLWKTNTTGTGPQQRLGAYAADWVLGHSITLLKDQTSNYTYTNPAPGVPNGFTEVSYPRYPYTVNGITVSVSNLTTPILAEKQYIPYQANMTPLGYYSPDSNYYSIKNNAYSSTYTVAQSSRYDLANVTPEQYRRAIADTILQWRNAGYFGGYLWWNPLVYNLAAEQQPPGAAPYAISSTVSYFANPLTNLTTPPLYQFGYYDHGTGGTFTQLMDNNLTPRAVPPELARPAVNPQIQTPLTSAMVGQIAPYFLQHCSQFIVEYAGDYLTQDTAGDLTGIGPDGQIDYYVDANGNKQIRWYGMPRSNSNSAIIYGVPNPNETGNTRTSADFPSPAAPNISIPISYWNNGGKIEVGLPDVIPLRDYYSLYYNAYYGTSGVIYQPPWEVDVNFDYSAYYANVNDPPVADSNGLGPGHEFHLYNPAVVGDLPINSPRYVAAWYNDMPAMVRILIKVDDPNDKLKDGPWYVYVFKLK